MSPLDKYRVIKQRAARHTKVGDVLVYGPVSRALSEREDDARVTEWLTGKKKVKGFPESQTSFYS